MASEEFLDGLSGLFGEGEETVGVSAEVGETIDDVVAQGADGQAAEFSEAGVKPELDADGNPVKGKDPVDGMKEGSKDVADAAKEGKSIVEKLKEAKKYMWDNRWKFAKLVGMEVGKGALFTAGMKAVEELWDLATKSDPSPTNNERSKIIQACNQAGNIISPVITEWRAWLAAHFDDRDNYGSVTVEDIDITRFQILQAKLSDFTTLQDAIYTLAVTANTNKDVPSANALLEKWKDYVGKVVAVGEDIKTKEPLMVADGLKDHSDDLAKATDALNSA